MDHARNPAAASRNRPAETITDGGRDRSPRDAAAWLFDLDNTLYRPECALFDQIDQRMRAFIGRELTLDEDAAHALQKRYWREFGTTLRGLMLVNGVAPGAFLDFVHDIDLSPLSPAPSLGAALDRLPGRKIVFTNASISHAERVLERLGIAERFEAVFDIIAADYRPKPDPAAYETVCRRFALDPARTVMVEDTARNLEPAAALGMMTVWVTQTASPDAGAAAGETAIDHVVADLPHWLNGLSTGT